MTSLKVGSPKRHGAHAAVAVGSAIVAGAFVVGAFAVGGGAGTKVARPAAKVHATDPPGVLVARKRVVAAEAQPQFHAPGPPFDARRAKGKTVFVLGSSYSFAVLSSEARGQAQAAKLVGVKLINFDGKANVTDYVRGMQRAIAAKVDVIMLDSISTVLLAPQIRQAKKAGIKIIAANEHDEGFKPLNPDTNAVTAFKYGQAGQLMADWIIQDSHGKANILTVNTPETVVSRDIKNGIDSELKRYCPGCSIIHTNTTIANYPQIGTFARTQLTKHPEVTYLLPFYDSMISAGISGSLRQAGLTGRVKLVSWNATPVILQLFKTNQVSADVGAPNVWMGWAQMDQALRVILGLPPVNSTRVPLRIWTRSDIGQINVGGDEIQWYGTAFQNGYKKLWGLSK